MRRVTLNNIPAAPSGKAGWPWTVETPPLPDTMPGGVPWSRMSIVTPSFNQGAFIEETIRSVLLQGYPNLEYIVIDGGSTDGSVEIIEKYSPWISHWVSEPDRGQCHAINKGLNRATGDIWAYMNSDDRYESVTFAKVANAFHTHPGQHWVTGHARYVNEDGEELETLVPRPFANLADTLVRWKGPRAVAIQVSNFMARDVVNKYGGFDESLHYSMDFEFGLRLLADGVVPIIIPEVLAHARLHGASKTVSQGKEGAFAQEDLKIVEIFMDRLPHHDRVYVLREVAECRFHFDLGEVSQHIEKGEMWNFVRALARMGLRHPSYLIRRPTLGMVRGWLFPT